MEITHAYIPQSRKCKGFAIPRSRVNQVLLILFPQADTIFTDFQTKFQFLNWKSSHSQKDLDLWCKHFKEREVRIEIEIVVLI